MRTVTFKKLLPIVVCVFLAALASVAVAGRLEVRNQAYEVMDTFEKEGYSVRELQIGILRAGEPYYFDTQLTAGNNYVFYAAGDKDLKGVYIEVYDENWELASESTGAETTAEVRYVPKWTGTFHVKVDMNGVASGEAYWFIVSGYK